jgi:transketolase
LGEEEVRGAKRSYGWPEDAHFLVPDDVRQHFAEAMRKRGRELREAWQTRLVEYKKAHPQLADQLERMQRRELPAGWDAELPTFKADPKGIASRDSSGQVLNALARRVPWLIGGAADLFPSTKTRLTFEGAGDFEADDRIGRNFHFGIREHAMAAICNGLSLSKIRPFGSGFLIFSDYLKPSLRLSALMELPVIYVFTHDSIGLGEDGPTHQPIEQLAALRSIPHLITMRPADANEVLEGWRAVMPLQHQPVAFILSRQALPTFDRSKYAPAAGVKHGAYVLADAPGGKPDVILMASGSEVSMCLEAYERLGRENVHARVVSMPSWELFELQSQEYRDSVLPSAVRARVSVEAAGVFGWSRYVGLDGASIGMRTFGASAPIKELLTHFGFTVDHILTAAREQLAKAGTTSA